MGVWRVSGSTLLQNLAVKSFVLNSTLSGNKFMGILNRMGMQIASKVLLEVLAIRYCNLAPTTSSIRNWISFAKGGGKEAGAGGKGVWGIAKVRCIMCCLHTGSNRGPTAYEAVALPLELYRRLRVLIGALKLTHIHF
eukprot:1148942-Pelagomonas_calceolata.AAC.1